MQVVLSVLIKFILKCNIQGFVNYVIPNSLFILSCIMYHTRANNGYGIRYPTAYVMHIRFQTHEIRTLDFLFSVYHDFQLLYTLDTFIVEPSPG